MPAAMDGGGAHDEDGLPQRVYLKSSDNEDFEMDTDVACMSVTVANMLEDTGSAAPVPLPNVNSKILAKVLEYCNYHHTTKDADEERAKWDKDFVAVDDETLFNLILAANYLDIKLLLDLACKSVADEIKSCKSPEEIRKRFNIKNDFTPEEEEEVRRENAWIDDR